MAIIVDYQKVREESQEVEYIFGYPTMDRRMVIQTATREGTPLDGNRDLLFRRAYVKIVRTHMAENAWPDRGTYAA